MRNPQEEISFKLIDNNGRFTVSREGNGVYSFVEFICTKNGISAHNGLGEIVIAATLTLNDDGDCRLKAGEEGSLLTLPQFRKRALESLFFDF